MAEGEGDQVKQARSKKRLLFITNCILVIMGNCGGPLVNRLYFIHGGNSIWLSTFLQTAAFPITLIPLSILFIIRRRESKNETLDSTLGDLPPADITHTNKPNAISLHLRLLVASVILGALIFLSSFLYSLGFRRLPVSTTTLITATQLVFTSLFAFVLVKQKFTAYSVNAVVLLTVGVGVLAMHGGGDRPAGESDKNYVVGFVMMLLGAAVAGLVLPLLEVVYKKSGKSISYALVLELQLLLGFFATLFSIVGMIIAHEFKAIPKEARSFELGEANYYILLVAITILWQLLFIGSAGIIFCASSLFTGVMVTVLIPITQVLAVIFYKEKFKAEKGVSLILSLWGFVSYFYGEYKQMKKREGIVVVSEV